jgi:hypothetical protein
MPNPLPNRKTAHLKRGGQFHNKGRPKPTLVDSQVRRISKRLILDPAHQKMLKERMRDGSLHPSVMVLLYYYGFGKPKETIETTPPIPVRIQHVYADAPSE